MYRSATFTVILLMISALPTLTQTAPTDSQTLQAILAELRQLRHDLQTTSAMAARAQIALYRLQREDEAVRHATQRVTDAKSRVTELENAKNRKAQDIEQNRAVADRSNSANVQQEF